jgi:predicted ATPase
MEKVASRNYGKYLPKLVLKHLRGFREVPITFDFPVTALIGPNGGGKTTILGAAACAYKMIAPKLFFSKSGKYDDAMHGWSIEYELIDKGVNQRDIIRRTASFKRSRWNRDGLERRVFYFGVSRTVPAHERRELSQCATSSFSVPASRSDLLSLEAASAISKILGKDVTQFRRLRVDESGKITFLTGMTKAGESYSEFHFGAGESSIIRMVVDIEAAPDQSLILIEEIENGLHPVATIRMVEYLIDVAERKKVQTIFTTHSNDALSPLPDKAIWVATQDRVFQGKLDIHSLRAITGQVDTKLIIYVEDDFAKLWVGAMLRQIGGVALDHLEIHAMGGDGVAVSVNQHHNADPSSDIPSCCIIDGDSPQQESYGEKVLRLPGQAPETHVFDTVMQDWHEYGGRLTVALLQPFGSQEHVKRVCEEVRIANRDPHNLFEQVGLRLGLLPGETIAAAFVTIFSQAHLQEVNAVLKPIKGIIPNDLASEPSPDLK